jgi:hypothetical protein
VPEPQVVRLFLSTVSDEFRSYRDLLRSDLTRHNVEVKVQEDFKDLGGITLDKLDVYIKACDAVVHLVGDMTGAYAQKLSTKAILDEYPDLPGKLPPLGAALGEGVPISYTQWEAWLALYHDKVLLIARADDAAPRGPRYAPTDASRAAAKAHLARLRAVERYPGSTFTSPDDLAKQIAYTTILDLLAKAQSTSDQFYGSDIAKILGPLVMAAPGAFVGWFAGHSAALGPALTALLSTLSGVSFLTFSLIYVRDIGVLGAGGKAVGSPERQAYDKLCASLAGDNWPARVYSRRLTAFLDWVERFFGDVGMADRTLFPHAFGLKTPAPLWTAPAFDRCLLLALLYPIATICVIWAISGHVGPAEAALGLDRDVPGWERALAAAAAGFSSFAFWRGIRTRGRKSIIWITVGVAFAFCGVFAGAANFIFAFAAAFAFAGVFDGAVAVTVAVAFAVVVAGLFAVALALGVASAIAGFDFVFGTVGAVPIYFFVIVTVAGYLVLIVAGAGAVAGPVALLRALSIKHRWHGFFLSLLLPAMILACLAAAAFLSHSTYCTLAGPLVLFLALLTALHAPFDWASLGLTRALLRRGLELGGWWPYLLALIDALLAAVIIAALALVMVVFVQAFDELAVHRGGKPVLPLDTLFDGIAKNPAAPEYWWAYALLLSTMIPSLVNLIIGGTSLLRGIPGLPTLLLQSMPAGTAVPAFDRTWMALVLTGQIFVGALLGIAAQALLALGLIFHVMPWIGLDLLDMARAVAAFDWPARVGQFFAGAA